MTVDLSRDSDICYEKCSSRNVSQRVDQAEVRISRYFIEIEARLVLDVSTKIIPQGNIVSPMSIPLVPWSVPRGAVIKMFLLMNTPPLEFTSLEICHISESLEKKLAGTWR
jgi:hypothetical protein